MKRTQDRIKDYVEPQAFDEVPDVAADPARALGAYRFTDATSDLLARWLDSLADLPRGHGVARALAGVRGVGKSHTLAVFAGLAARPELRTAVKDAHAATSARRLLNRRHTVVRVARGLKPTLAEELADALSGAFGGGAAVWGTDPEAMLAVAASRVHDAALVVIVDTAHNRAGRVKRDDGPALSRLAQAARASGAFVALALDDDIADASGVNSVLAGAYQIDYLDPEHLYRVADQYLLRKNPQARAALHDIYLSLRAAVPGFNWSEPRFAALYPVHPLVADVASAVRLYAPSFAFLPFAAAASIRAASRPALSLILLDEVFDRAEHDLRKAEELREAFGAYDELATKGVARLPVMQRLQAKLVLKSLFIHSLDGRGASAAELCAGLLLGADDGAPTAAVRRVEEMLAALAGAAPDALGAASENGETRHRFQINAPARFERALAESVGRATTDEQSVRALLCAAARAQFADWPLLPGAQGGEVRDADFQISWRGTERAGRILWRGGHPDAAAPPSAARPGIEWQVVVRAPGAAGAQPAAGRDVNADGPGASATPVSLVWQPAPLTAEEADILRRLAVLRSDTSLVAEFGETAHAAACTLAAQAQRIWARLYVDEGALARGAEVLRFGEGARASRSLADALARTLEPLFAVRYPQHPAFEETFGEAEVAPLTEWFLGNVGASEERVRRLARTFAVPLGLAALREEGECVFLSGGEAAATVAPWVAALGALLDSANEGETVPLDAVRELLAGEPYGLAPEAQRLLLAALVARREAELVTASGERVGRHALLSVRWETLTGASRPAEAASPESAEELTAWARALTGREALPSLAEKGAPQAAREALREWLDGWRVARVVERFGTLPEEVLTTRVWGACSAVRKSFGASADAVAAALADEISLEEGLRRVADAFARSPEIFARNSRLLAELTAFVEEQPERERARAYLAFAETTGREEIESARRELLELAEDAHGLYDPARRGRFDLLWREFRARYAEHYAAEHERASKASRERRPELESLTAGERWQEFELLSELPVVNRRAWEEAAELLRRGAAAASCELPVRRLLESQPSCACQFRLAHAARLARLPEALEESLARGLASYRRTLMLLSRHLRLALAALAEESDAETASRARALGNALAVGLTPAHLSRANVRLIERALRAADWQHAQVRVLPPFDAAGPLTREELEARLREWLDELPAGPVQVESAGEKETHAA